MPGKTAGRASVRCSSLNMAGLKSAEDHGKRLDKTSQMRVIRDKQPVVYRSLDLTDAYEKHMQGVKQNRGAKKPVLHFLVRFPPELLGDDVPGRFAGKSKEQRHVEMMWQAVDFINKTHGGDAVFAARIDRDEEGETIVDLFASPKYEKRTKRTAPDQKGDTWASATKYGRELAERHQDEIRRRHPDAKSRTDLTGPRMVGIALQSEFAQFFQKRNGMPLEAKREKLSKRSDRLEVEQWRALEAARSEHAAEVAEADRRADIRQRWQARGAFRLDRDRAVLEVDRASVAVDRAALDTGCAALDADVASLASDRAELAKGRAALDADVAALASVRKTLVDDRAQVESYKAAAYANAKTWANKIREGRSEIEQGNAKLAADTDVLAKELRQVRGIKETLTALLDSVRDLLSRADLPKEIRKEATKATMDIMAVIRPPKRSAPEKTLQPVQDTATPDIDGP